VAGPNSAVRQAGVVAPSFPGYRVEEVVPRRVDYPHVLADPTAVAFADRETGCAVVAVQVRLTVPGSGRSFHRTSLHNSSAPRTWDKFEIVALYLLDFSIPRHC